MQPGDVRRIMRRTRRIEGWFSRDAAALIALLDEAQLTAGVRGNIFEIGVHHGRSVAFLCALARDEERLGVCDLFGEQTLNVSASGSGNRAVFEANIAAAAPGFNKLVIVPAAAAGIYEPLICDSRMLWRYFDKHVFEMKQLPMAGRDMFIMLVPTWRQRPELDRNVARLLSRLKILGSGLSRSRALDFLGSRERNLHANPGS